MMGAIADRVSPFLPDHPRHWRAFACEGAERATPGGDEAVLFDGRRKRESASVHREDSGHGSRAGVVHDRDARHDGSCRSRDTAVGNLDEAPARRRICGRQDSLPVPIRGTRRQRAVPVRRPHHSRKPGAAVSASGAPRQRPNATTQPRNGPTTPSSGTPSCRVNASHSTPAVIGTSWRPASPRITPGRDASPNR